MANLILHIPHASLRIPDYGKYLLPREAVDAEALHLADLYTDELFLPAQGDAVIQADFGTHVEIWHGRHLRAMR